MVKESNTVEVEEIEEKGIHRFFLPILNQYYYKTTYVFNNITSYKNDILLDFILGFGILRIANILLNNTFNNTFFFGIIIFFIYIWEHWFILSHHSDLIGFPECISWLSHIIKYGSYILMIFCIREDVISEIKKPNAFFNFFIIMSIIIRLYCVVTYIMAAPGPKYLLVCLPMYSIVALTPLIISIFIKKSVTEKYVIYYTTFIIDILFFVIIVFIQSRLYATLNMLSTGSGNTDKFPIFNKKNWIERFTLLTLLLIVIPVVFIPSYSFSITIHNIIYTIICGIIVISSGYIYNSVNSVLTINHALNLISPFFGCIWRLLHLPLHLGLTLIGVSLSIIVKNIYVYRNYPNNTFDETLSPKLPSSYYSGLEIFYTSDKFKSQSTSEEVHSRNNNINLGKAVHSIDEIKALLAVAFLLTFISVFLMKFLHRYTSSTIIDNSSNENNSYENIKKTNISASTKSINTNNSTENQNVIKSSIDFNNDEANGESNSKVTTNSETNIESAINNNMNRKNLLKMDSKASINSEQLKLRKENFYRLKKDSLKNSIMDLANNKSFANPKAQNIIDKCSNEKIANNISEMNNNAVITTYINSSLTIHSFFIFLFQISLILLFLIFNYIKIPVTVLLILTLIIVEIELLSEIFLPRILKITNKRKNIKILPAEKVNDLMRSESSLNNI